MVYGGRGPANSNPKYLVPRNTAAVLKTAGDGYCHLGLLLGRYAPAQIIDSDTPWDRRTKWRDHWLKNDVLPRFGTATAPLKNLQGAVYKRWQHSTADAETFTAKTLGRLIVGLGGKGVLETGITLDHVTGLPIIPGSALKGLTRTYALLVIAERLGIPILSAKQLKELKVASPLEILDAALIESNDKARQEALTLLTQALPEVDLQLVGRLAGKLNRLPKATLYRKAFGSQEDSGDCIFYEAVVAELPKTKTLFELDVMTPHFKEYYDDVNSSSPKFNRPPHDGQNPVPISFVAVAAGTTFAFAVGLRRGGDRAAVSQAVQWLKQALYVLGVGAKTAAGYGVFEKLK